MYKTTKTTFVLIFTFALLTFISFRYFQIINAQISCDINHCIFLPIIMRPDGVSVSTRTTAPTATRTTAPTATPTTAPTATPISATPCFVWPGQSSLSLQSAVDTYTCVEIQPGIWETNTQIALSKPGHRLIGKDRDQTILKAISPWLGNEKINNDSEAIVHDNGMVGVTIANFTIDASNLGSLGIGATGDGTTVDSMRIINSKCAGIAIVGPRWKVLNSIIEGNGKSCPQPFPGAPGAGIYLTKQTSSDYAPVIQGNTLRNNGGPALDVDRVWGGVFSHNTVSDNQGWAAVTLYGASYWTIEDNIITHPMSANPSHPNHEYCMGGPSGNYPVGISICKDSKEPEVSNYNIIRNNQVSSWYGIRLIGEDESNILLTPRFTTVQGNNVLGSMVGCADDLEPNRTNEGINTWSNNNCGGQPDTLPLYFNTLCPSGVRRSTVQTWQIGVTVPLVVDEYVARFNDGRSGGSFLTGDSIPTGVIVATNFEQAGVTWDQFQVKPIVHNRSYGLFETTNSYLAPYPGACLMIVP